jgi:nucleoid-associated protein YgaU
MTDIKVADETIYHRNTAVSVESMSKIAKHYYGKPMKYTAIFEANKNILSNPDVIHPGQELIIPNV